MDLLVVGTSHSVAPAAIRDAVALTADGAADVLDLLGADDRIDEAVVLATCTRTEVYARARRPELAARICWRAVASAAGREAPAGPHAYVRTGSAAVAHLFRVAAGVDSLIVGEHQVLGQVREALALAEGRDAVGAPLSRLFQAAVRTGRRARSETAIGVGPVSVPCAGVRLVRRTLGDLSSARVVVVGAGRTGMAVCRFLTRRELGGLVVVNRSPARARAVADRFGGTTAPWDELVGAVADADAVLAATHAPSAVLTRALLEPVAAARRGRPLLLVDLSAPRNVDPAAGTLEGVTVRDLDHLGELVDDNLTARAAEVPLVEEIIDHEARRFARWYERLRRPVAYQPSVEPVQETGAA